jgi:hypothetical protein
MVSTISAVIRISVEGGATSKIGEVRFGKCRLTITPPEEEFSEKKKISRRGPTGPPNGTTTAMGEEDPDQGRRQLDTDVAKAYNAFVEGQNNTSKEEYDRFKARYAANNRSVLHQQRCQPVARRYWIVLVPSSWKNRTGKLEGSLPGN